MKNTEIARYMRDQYLVSPEKTALAVTIANRERDILKNIDYENEKLEKVHVFSEYFTFYASRFVCSANRR